MNMMEETKIAAKDVAKSNSKKWKGIGFCEILQKNGRYCNKTITRDDGRCVWHLKDKEFYDAEREKAWAERAAKDKIAEEARQAINPKIEIDEALGVVANLPTVNKKLTDKQLAVIYDYLITRDEKASWAKHYSVGNDPKKVKEKTTQGAKNFFANPSVKAFIKREREKIYERFQATLENTVKVFANIAYADITDFVTITQKLDENGKPMKVDGVPVMVMTIKPTETLTKEQTAAIQTFKEVSGQLMPILYNKLEAAGKLGDYQGMFVKKLEVTGAGGEPLTIQFIAPEKYPIGNAPPQLINGVGSEN